MYPSHPPGRRSRYPGTQKSPAAAPKYVNHAPHCPTVDNGTVVRRGVLTVMIIGGIYLRGNKGFPPPCGNKITCYRRLGWEAWTSDPPQQADPLENQTLTPSETKFISQLIPAAEGFSCAMMQDYIRMTVVTARRSCYTCAGTSLSR